jgi:uncharacterized membrane protein (UPF0127 family)
MTVVTDETAGRILAGRAETAIGAWAQFAGLMGRSGLQPDHALVLPRTRGVHTHFMRFAIDVVFYDKDQVIVGVEHGLVPWRFSAYHRRAKGAIELPAGTLRASGTRDGHVLSVTEPSVTSPLHLPDSQSTPARNTADAREPAAKRSSTCTQEG